MDELIKWIKEFDKALDQAAIGKSRVLDTIAYATKVGVAIRNADLGNTTNQFLDAALPVLVKLQGLLS